MKLCAKCGNTKPLSDFHRNGRDALGKPTWKPLCIACVRKAADTTADKARAVAMWQAGGIGVRRIARTLGRHYSTAARWLQEAGCDTRTRGRGQHGRRGDPQALAPIGDAPSFAAIDAAIMRARIDAGMVDGQRRMTANPWPAQSSLT